MELWRRQEDPGGEGGGGGVVTDRVSDFKFLFLDYQLCKLACLPEELRPSSLRGASAEQHHPRHSGGVKQPPHPPRGGADKALGNWSGSQRRTYFGLSQSHRFPDVSSRGGERGGGTRCRKLSHPPLRQFQIQLMSGASRLAADPVAYLCPSCEGPPLSHFLPGVRAPS